MPDGKVHTKFNIKVFFVLTIATSLYMIVEQSLLINYYIFDAAIVVGTIFLSPDLDQNGSISDRILPWKFELFWNPYSGLFKHRKISHCPILGTISRILYIFVFTAIAINWKPIYESLELMISYCINNKWCWFAFAGIEVSSLSHGYLDITKKDKKKKR